MENLTNNLFLLTANLSQRKERNSIIRLFIQGLNSFLPHVFFTWEDETGKDAILEVSTQKKVYGEIKFSDPFLQRDREVMANLQNAAQMLAVILERLEQEQLLNNEKNLLEQTVSERTIELNTKMEEYEALYEEHKDLNIKLKDSLDKLEKSEEQLRSIVENSSNVFFRAGTNQVLTYLSPQIHKILGYEPEEAMVKWTDLITDEPMNQKGVELTEAAIATGKAQELFEMELYHKSGEKIYVEVRQAPVVKNGKTVAIVGALIDITGRKKAQKELLKNQYYLKKAQEIAKIGTWELDIPNNVLVWTEEHYRIFGIPQGTPLTLERFFACVHPNDIEYVTHKWNAALQHKHYEVEHRILVNNRVKWIKQKAYLDFTGDGRPSKAIGFSQDITERMYDQEKLRKSEEKFKSYIENAPDGVFLTDEHGIYLEVNPAACRLTGYTEEELLNRNLMHLTPAENMDQVKQLLRQLKYEGYMSVELPYLTKENEKRYWSVDAVRLTRNFFIAFKKDITDRVEHEQKINEQNVILEKSLQQIRKTSEELKTAKNRAEESDRLKSAFLANISHEIRTPMNGVLGFVDLLMNTNITADKMDQYLNMVKKSGERLLFTINDIIEISKIEAGQTPNSYTSEDINDILQYMYSVFQQEADKRGIILKMQLPEKGHRFFQVDRKKLESIIVNLLKNALKFTVEGEIKFGYHSDGNLLRFYVSDTGVGIPPERKAQIFERFVQADMEFSRPYEGSGLGLSIAKAYIEMLGGKIWVESEVGKGSTFRFTMEGVPVKMKKISTGEGNLNGKFFTDAQKLILIAEDDNTSARLLESIFSTITSFKLLRAKNGNEAVQLCHDHPDIDLVLMDIKMPEMDGLDATRSIRKFNKKVPIIAQSAYALPEDNIRAMEAGCNDYITKPIKSEILLNKVRQQLQERVN